MRCDADAADAKCRYGEQCMGIPYIPFSQSHFPAPFFFRFASIHILDAYTAVLSFHTNTSSFHLLFSFPVAVPNPVRASKLRSRASDTLVLAPANSTGDICPNCTLP